MSNDPRPAKPPLPLLKRSKSGTVPATRRDRESAVRGQKPSETARSGTIAAVRPASVVASPRPTNVLRRLDPAFSPDDGSGSWEPRGTLVGGSYRDSLPTIPSPEELESRLLAELAAAEPKPSAAEPKPSAAEPSAAKPKPSAAEKFIPVEAAPIRPGARAHFEPAHAPAVRVSPIIELDKAVPVILDPLAIAGGLPADPEPLEDFPSASMLLLAPAQAIALPEAVPLVPSVTAPEIEPDAGAEGLPLEVSGESELARAPSERSRITVSPAQRRRRRPLRAVLLGVLVLSAVAGAGWYRYPAECQQGWQLARAELTVWGSALEQQWSARRSALGL